jgi:anti-sigma B factor antagonist
VSIPYPRLRSVDSPLLSLTTTETWIGLVVVKARGEIDMQTAPELATALNAAVDSFFPHRLVVDLDEVEFIGSGGLHILLEFDERCDRRDIDMRLVSGARPVRRALQVTGLDRTLKVYDSLSSLTWAR